MNTIDFLALLKASPQQRIHVMLPSGAFVPEHFHVTEIGCVKKDFIDCGGIIRTSATCVVQLWVADDVDHRIETDKLLSIFTLAQKILPETALPIEFEYEAGLVSQYPIKCVDLTPGGLLVELATKHTACLAPQLCGVTSQRGCCGPGECC